jgi:multisubunit Na+/H+ antiporter MnhC subunit
MNLVKLLLIHAIVTFAAGVVLLVAPDLIPRTVGIRITSSVYLVCYLLGTSELGLAPFVWSNQTGACI